MVAGKLNGTATSTRPASRHRTAWDQSLVVQLQPAYAVFAEDGKSVNCLAHQKTFGKRTILIKTIQNPYWGGGGPWKRHQDSATHIAAMEAHNSQTNN
jgi:hypothetical protein